MTDAGDFHGILAHVGRCPGERAIGPDRTHPPSRLGSSKISAIKTLRPDANPGPRRAPGAIPNAPRPQNFGDLGLSDRDFRLIAS